MTSRVKGSIFFLMALASNLGLTRSESRAQSIPVNFGVTFRNARLAPLWMAEEEGFFKKQGLEVKTVNIAGGTRTRENNE